MPRKKKDLHRSNTNTNANLTKHVSIEFSTNQPRSGYGEDNIKKSRRQSTGQFTTLDTKAIRALSAKSPETKTTNISPPHTPAALTLNDVFNLDNEADTKARKNLRGFTRSDSLLESNASDTSDAQQEDISVLHRFRMALRAVGSNATDAESFINQLRHEYVGDWDSAGPDSPSRQGKVPSKKKDVESITLSGLKEEDLRTRVQHILKDSDISDHDIEDIFETIDQDGNGALEWEEFLSFLSLSPASLRLVITKLQDAFKHDIASKHDNKLESFFNSLTNGASIFEYTHLEQYLRTHQAMKAIILTPGEINWLFDQMCGDHVMEVSIVEMFTFVKSFHLSHEVSDKNYPVVDIKVSHSKTDEDEYERLHYHRIPENLQSKDSKKKSDPIYLWFRTGSVEDYKNKAKLSRARITDIIVNSDKNNHQLLQQGFRCVEKSLTSTKKKYNDPNKITPQAKYKKNKTPPVYLWIRRNWRDPNPVLNIAMTSGKAKNLNDKIHFPPFAGFKLTEPMHNLNVGSGKDIFLWYRKDSFDHEIFGVMNGETIGSSMNNSSGISSSSFKFGDSPRSSMNSADNISRATSSPALASTSPIPPSTILNRPPSLWEMNNYRHLFVEMDELQQFGKKKEAVGWVHTHRWNHGLESNWNETLSMWSRPKIPTISLFGLNALLERLESSHIMFDVKGDTFDQVMSQITKIAVERGLVPKKMRKVVLNCLTQNERRRSIAVNKAIKKRKEEREKKEEEGEEQNVFDSTTTSNTNENEKGEAVTEAKANDTDKNVAFRNTSILSSPELKTNPSKIHRNVNDALEQDGDEDAVHIMVGEVDFLDADERDDTNPEIILHEKNLDNESSEEKEEKERERTSIGNNLLIFARSLSPVDVGMDEKNAKFFIVILGNSTAKARQIDMEMGCSFASLLQDEKIVACLYESHNANMLMDVLRKRLHDIHMVPQIHRPTKKGIKKRSRRLTRMLQVMQDRYSEKLDQGSRWRLRQGDTLKDGITLHSLWAFAAKYAMPLLFGILLALVWSNIDNDSYQALCGPSHHGSSSSGGGSSSSLSNSSSNSSSSHRMLLSSSSASASASASSLGITPSKPTILNLHFDGHDVTLNFLVNDVLMTFFFGLAVKEITEALQKGGSLHPINKAINPLIGTLGGVIGPIAIYFIVISIQSATGAFGDQVDFSVIANGWGIPTATDISLAWVTALVVFGPGHPAIEHLLLLAIVDDAIGLIIIAVAYGDTSGGFEWWWLLFIGVGVFVAWSLSKLKVMRWELYVGLAGPFCWFGLLMASLHPALALAFVVPFMPSHLEKKENEEEEKDVEKGPEEDEEEDEDEDLEEHVKQHEAHGEHAPLHQFEHDLKWFVDCVVLFLFGLTNAGVQLNGIGQLTISIMAALVVGKTLGIGFFTLFAVKVLNIPLPKGMKMGDVWLLGFIAAIGLTVALFVAGEAFRESPQLMAEAKMGALLSVVVGIVAVFISKTPCGGRCISQVGSGGSASESTDLNLGDVEEEPDEEDDDEELDDVIVRSMTSTLTSMKRNVKKVEQTTGVDHKKLMKRYNHARKRMAKAQEQASAQRER